MMGARADQKAGSCSTHMSGSSAWGQTSASSSSIWDGVNSKIAPFEPGLNEEDPYIKLFTVSSLLSTLYCMVILLRCLLLQSVPAKASLVKNLHKGNNLPITGLVSIHQGIKFLFQLHSCWRMSSGSVVRALMASVTVTHSSQLSLAAARAASTEITSNTFIVGLWPDNVVFSFLISTSD